MIARYSEIVKITVPKGIRRQYSYGFEDKEYWAKHAHYLMNIFEKRPTPMAEFVNYDVPAFTLCESRLLKTATFRKKDLSCCQRFESFGIHQGRAVRYWNRQWLRSLCKRDDARCWGPRQSEWVVNRKELEVLMFQVWYQLRCSNLMLSTQDFLLRQVFMGVRNVSISISLSHFFSCSVPEAWWILRK